MEIRIVAPAHNAARSRIRISASRISGFRGKRLMLRLMVAFLCAARMGPAGLAAPTLEDFAANDAVDKPQISPDGSEIAYLNSSGRDMGLALYHLGTGKGEILCRVDSHTDAFAWKGNDRILFFEDTPVPATCAASLPAGTP